MNFLDTCIWLELCAISNPTDQKGLNRLTKVSNLYAKLLRNKADIVTMKIQLIEVINAILKAKMKEYNKKQKAIGEKGVGQLKDYRKTNDYESALILCRSTVLDITKKARIVEINNDDIDVDQVIDDLLLVDINDSIYCSYCNKNNISIYTIDSDYLNLSYTNIIVL